VKYLVAIDNHTNLSLESQSFDGDKELGLAGLFQTYFSTATACQDMHSTRHAILDRAMRSDASTMILRSECPQCYIHHLYRLPSLLRLIGAQWFRRFVFRASFGNWCCLRSPPAQSCRCPGCTYHMEQNTVEGLEEFFRILLEVQTAGYNVIYSTAPTLLRSHTPYSSSIFCGPFNHKLC
jgi:hypothetical protein